MSSHEYQYRPITQGYFGIDPQQKDDPFDGRSYYIFPPGMQPKEEEPDPHTIADGIHLKVLDDSEDIIGVYITLTNKGEQTVHVGVPLHITDVYTTHNLGKDVAQYACNIFATNGVYLTNIAKAHIAGYINGLCERILSEQ